LGKKKAAGWGGPLPTAFPRLQLQHAETKLKLTSAIHPYMNKNCATSTLFSLSTDPIVQETFKESGNKMQAIKKFYITRLS
jgi:hypothetical protein